MPSEKESNGAPKTKRIKTVTDLIDLKSEVKKSLKPVVRSAIQDLPPGQISVLMNEVIHELLSECKNKKNKCQGEGKVSKVDWTVRKETVQNQETEETVQNQETEETVQSQETEETAQSQETEETVQNQETEETTPNQKRRVGSAILDHIASGGSKPFEPWQAYAATGIRSATKSSAGESAPTAESAATSGATARLTVSQKGGGTGRKSCFLSFCPCSSQTCGMKSAAKETPKHEYWKKFLQSYDPISCDHTSRRKNGMLYLCACHFDTSSSLIIPPALEKTVDLIRKKDQEMRRLEDCICKLITKDQLSLLMRSIKEQETNEETSQTAHVQKRKRKREFSSEAMVKAVEMFDKLQSKNYSYLISLGWPLPSRRTVLRFKANLTGGIEQDVIKAVQSMEDDE